MRRIYLLLLDVTSIPLLILLYLMYLSGYGITKSEIVMTMTFGLLNYETSLFIHLSIIKYVAAVLMVIHGVAGFCMWVGRSKRIKRKRLAEMLLWLLGFALLIKFTIIEFY